MAMLNSNCKEVVKEEPFLPHSTFRNSVVVVGSVTVACVWVILVSVSPGRYGCTCLTLLVSRAVDQ